MIYQVRVPVSGYRSFTVSAESPDEAVSLVSSGEVNYDGIASVDEDPDTNNWLIKELT